MPGEGMRQNTIETADEAGLGTDHVTTLPILILNVHERCNCRCLMCDIWKREDGAQFGVDELARHRESIMKLGVSQVVLTGGEPLLHSNLEALCGVLKDCGVKITLLSTGLLLKKRATLVASWMDEIILSLDGPAEVHDRVRRVRGAFQLIHEGIEAVREQRPGMPVHGRCTVQKENYARLRETVLAARRLGLDSISFLAADVSSRAFNRELVWPVERQDEVALSAGQVASLDAEIDMLIRDHCEDFRSSYIVEPPEKLRRIARRFREQLGQFPPQAPRCNAPWVSAVVEVDGSVRPCFFHRKIGNIKTGSLEEALNSEEARAFRSSLDIDSNPTCRRCVCSLHYKGESLIREPRTAN